MHYARLFAAAGLAALAMSIATHPRSSERPRVERFTIDVPAAVLSDLDERLARTRWPDQLPGTGWSYGADTAYLRELVDYWQREYDWREQERALNRFEHYRATIDGTRIHFVHARSRDPNAIPVLLLHGWPSTFVQMLDLIPLLTDPAAHGLPNAPSFHVVAASLPGFGFSDVPDAPRRRFRDERRAHGEAHARRARLRALRRARQRLGRRDRAADGAAASRASHRRAPDGHHRRGRRRAAVHGGRAGVHRRGRQGRARARVRALADVEAADARAFAERLAGRAWPRGSSRSFARGATATATSKAASARTSCITNLMVYWVTGTAPASVRMYYDFVREPLKAGRVERPVGMLMSTKDLFPPAPREFGERLLNVQHWVETDVGGHFLEWEEPELVARDLQTFFGAVSR